MIIRKILRLAMVMICAMCAAPLAHADLVSSEPLSAGFKSVFVYLSPTQRDAIARGRSGDLTASLQRILATNSRVSFPPGVYPIKSALIMRSGQAVRLSPGAEIRQTVIGQGAFVAIGKTDVTIELNGGTIRGPGGWSATWTGNQGLEGFRGVTCIGCSRFVARGPGRIVNWGNAGIGIVGGSNYRIEYLTVEGTHGYGKALSEGDNFQNGIYISNDPKWGRADDGRIVQPDITGVGQGILREALPYAPAPQKMTIIDNPYIHDIPGQHAIYNQDGQLQIIGGRYFNLAYSAVKFQSADADRDLFSMYAKGIKARNIGGSMFEIATLGRGSINQADVEGEGHGVGYLLSLNGKTRDFNAHLVGDEIKGNSVYVLGRDIRRTSIGVRANNIDQDGILVVATDTELTIAPQIRNPNRNRVPENSGIRVVSRSAHVTLNTPTITDMNGRMNYGLFNQWDGSTIRFIGKLVATGATQTALRADGVVDTLPEGAILSGKKGKFSGRYRIQ